MKKLFLVGALALFGAMNAQTTGNFKVGGHVGLPVGDISDASSFNAGVDLAYQWNLAENFKLGVASGYSQYFGKNGWDGTGLIPIAASGQYTVAPNFFLGADLGYGFFTADGADGGFYYQPKVGYQKDNWELYLGYKWISLDGGTVSSVNVGVNFNLGK